MKKIAITQRVQNIHSYNERRDSLDQKWVDFLLQLDQFPVIIPNNVKFSKILLDENDIDGVLLTGGGNLVKYNGNAPERDAVELFLLEWSLKNNKPCLGVCRGMQVIQNYFGIKLKPVLDHVSSRHSLNVKEGYRLSNILSELNSVNAYHDYGATLGSDELPTVAKSSDGVVMAVEHINKKLFGVMWHSERESPFIEQEKNIFKFVFDQ